MELKVWVDGIKRVVCGVTDHTTCQDIVIALAQAMGRTGRFTLIEQWRENERPLAPGECPLLVLQKWGEFSNEVKLILYESGTRRKQKVSENEKTVKKTEDRFSHNFTPPVKTSEAVIRRSLTFSGSRKPDMNSYKREEHVAPSYGTKILPNKTLAPPQRVMSDGNSWSSASSLSSQNSTAIPPQQRHVRSKSHDRNTSHDQHRRRPSPQPHPTQHSNHGGLPSHPTNHNYPPPYPNNLNHKHQQNIPPPNHHQNHRPQYTNVDHHKYNNHSVPVSNGPVRPSAFSPVMPRRNSHEDERDMMKNAKTDIPIYTQHKNSSHKQDLEEYDLDSNFPDVVKETGHDYLVEEYRVPGTKVDTHDHHGNLLSWEEQERVKLLRLVTMQNERIKMQDSQLDIIDTEISSREQKLEDLKLELNSVLEEFTDLSNTDKSQSEEIVTLDNSNLIEDMEEQKQIEKDMKSELNSLQARLDKCENDLHQFKTKVKLCSEDLEQEQEIQKTDEKKRKEAEVKLQNEILELKKNLEKRSQELNEKTKTAEDVQKELSKINEKFDGKTNELTAIEKELQKENMKFFKEPQTQESLSMKTHETNGEAVIKVLEGGLSPKLNRKLANNPLTILSVTKNKNGVWV